MNNVVKQLLKGCLNLLNCDDKYMFGYAETVKKGHFSVIAMANGEPEKFLIAIRYLSYPPFLKLLEKAEREFGFDQQGILIVPCEATELRRILVRARWR